MGWSPRITDPTKEQKEGDRNLESIDFYDIWTKTY